MRQRHLHHLLSPAAPGQRSEDPPTAIKPLARRSFSKAGKSELLQKSLKTEQIGPCHQFNRFIKIALKSRPVHHLHDKYGFSYKGMEIANKYYEISSNTLSTPYN
jgi:hypothetical protein